MTVINRKRQIGGFILSLVSILRAYLRCTSDVNGSNFRASRLLCSLGNVCSSKPPKYTFKSRSTRLTSLLTLHQNKIRKLKHQSNCNEIRHLDLAGKWRHAYLTQLLTSGLRFANKEKSTENSNFYKASCYKNKRLLCNGRARFWIFFICFETRVLLEVIKKEPTKKLWSQVSLVKFAPCALPWEGK